MYESSTSPPRRVGEKVSWIGVSSQPQPRSIPDHSEPYKVCWSYIHSATNTLSILVRRRTCCCYTIYNSINHWIWMLYVWGRWVGKVTVWGVFNISKKWESQGTVESIISRNTLHLGNCEYLWFISYHNKDKKSVNEVTNYVMTCKKKSLKA